MRRAMPAFAACDPGWTGANCVLCDPANTTACAAVYTGSTCAVESPEEAFNATTVLKGYDDCSVVESTLEGMTLDQASLYGRCGVNLTDLEGAWACRIFISATAPAADLKVELTNCTTPTNPPTDGELVVNCATVNKHPSAHMFGFPNSFLGMIAEPIVITARGPRASSSFPMGMPPSAATTSAAENTAAVVVADHPVSAAIAGARTGKA